MKEQWNILQCGLLEAKLVLYAGLYANARFACILSLALAVLAPFSLPSFAQSQESVAPVPIIQDVQKAKDAAQRDFPKFLTAALLKKADYGFKPDDTQANVSLGEPIFVYALPPEIIADLTVDGANLVSLIEPAGEWIFPVQVSNEYRTLFGVRLRGNGKEWKGSYLGNSDLAGKLQGIRLAWSAGDVDRFKLVSCVSPRAFFFISLDVPYANLTPVTMISLDSGEKMEPPSQWKEVRPAQIALEILKAYSKRQSEILDSGVSKLDNDTNGSVK